MSSGLVKVQAKVRRTVNRLHASLDLRVDPERRSFLHGAEEEGLKVQIDFVGAVLELIRLSGNDAGKVGISAPEDTDATLTNSRSPMDVQILSKRVPNSMVPFSDSNQKYAYLKE